LPFITTARLGVRPRAVYAVYGAQTAAGGGRRNEEDARMARRWTVAAGQFRCAVGDKDANLAKIEDMAADAAARGAQLVCFPELCTTGFDAERLNELAERVPGPTVKRLADIASLHGLYVLSGMLEADPSSGRLRNACVLLGPDGALVGHYRKRCLYLGENAVIQPGERNALCDVGSCTLALAICYDYVFAQYIRELVDAGAELICHPTAWLTTDVCEQWKYSPMAYRAMGMTRALENTVYFLSANLWGDYDPAGSLRAIGQSAIIAPWGEVLDEVRDGEGVAVATLDFDAPEGWRRAAAPYPEDRRRFGF
jgi:predicted amidohydrolase